MRSRESGTTSGAGSFIESRGLPSKYGFSSTLWKLTNHPLSGRGADLSRSSLVRARLVKTDPRASQVVALLLLLLLLSSLLSRVWDQASWDPTYRIHCFGAEVESEMWLKPVKSSKGTLVQPTSPCSKFPSSFRCPRDRNFQKPIFLCSSSHARDFDVPKHAGEISERLILSIHSMWQSR